MMQRGSWEYVERTNAGGMSVIIVAATPERKLLFVEQDARADPVARPSRCRPAWSATSTPSESLLLAAERELLEETGWRAGRIEHLMTGPSSAGMSTERMAFVRASGLERVHAGGGDDSEDILVHEIDDRRGAALAGAKLAEGYEIDAKVWAGLWLLDAQPGRLARLSVATASGSESVASTSAAAFSGS